MHWILTLATGTVVNYLYDYYGRGIGAHTHTFQLGMIAMWVALLVQHKL